MTDKALQLLKRGSELLVENGLGDTYDELAEIPYIGSKQVAGLAMAVAERLDEMDKRIEALEEQTDGK